jgi:type VI secretion system protein ImpJ
MRQLQKVLWAKGILLSPQHLQLQDRYLESVVEFALSALSFFPWGFSRLRIDPEAVAGGLFSVTQATGLFPDGLPFEVPEADGPLAPKPLDDYWQPDQTTLDVYLAVPEYRPGGQNVALGGGRDQARYAAEVEMRRDENTGLAEKPVQVARKRMRILVEGESQEGYSVLPLARVRRGAGGEVALDPHFVPPLVDILASDYLLSINRRLVELLSARSATLSGTRRQRNRGLADFGLSDVANFWLLYTVNTHLPQLRHLYEVRRGHPGALFEAMLGLAGALTTFSTKYHPRTLPLYDHTALGPCFQALDAVIRELLETVVPTNHVTLPLRPTEQASVQATAIDQDRYLAAPQLYLAIRAEMPREELLRRTPQLVKISSADQVERLIRQALPGMGLHHVADPPSAIPVKLDYQYFLIDQSGPEWDAVRRARNLAAYVPSDFIGPQLELVVVLPPER